MKGVDEENIRIDEIKDITGRRQLLASGNVKVLADTGVVIIYTIIIPDTLSAGFTNANDAFAQVKQQLQEATSSGDFTSKLQSIAQELGVTILATVVAGDLTVSEPVIITIPVPPENTSNESSDKDELNDGEIAGIVIGCVVFTGLVVGLLYYYYSHHWNKQGSGKVQPADIPMASVVPGSSSSIMPISEDQMKLVKTGSNTLAV